MEVVVFTDSSRVREAFRIGRKNRDFSRPIFYKRSELKSSLGTAAAGSLVYYDAGRMEDRDFRNVLRSLQSARTYFFGIIDSAGRIKDPADLFHRGAVDFVNRHVLSAGITARRLARIVSHLEKHDSGAALPDREATIGETRIPVSGWEKISEGSEYTFNLLFIEMDGREEMEKRYDRSNLSRALGSVRSYVERFAASFGGKVWMWADFGGIILFPFDGGESRALRFGFRFQLFKHFYDIEESQFPNFLSFRIAILIGNLVYSQKNKGHIISDSLNSIFHIGQQYAESGGLYVASDVFGRSSKAYLNYFIDAGVFEGRKIFRMRHPLHSGRSLEEL